MDLAIYHLQPGERLSDVARSRGVSPTVLARLNPHKEAVFVPGVGEVFADPIEGEAIYIPARQPGLGEIATERALAHASALGLGELPDGGAQVGLGDTGNMSTASIAGLAILGIAITAGVGALVGTGVAAMVAGNNQPQYMKGAAIGAGGGLLLATLLPRNS